MNVTVSLDYSREALKVRHPHYRDQIDKGDLKIYLNQKGCVVVEWANTAIFKPSFQDLAAIVALEFPKRERPDLIFEAGFMSLMVTSPVPRKVS